MAKWNPFEKQILNADPDEFAGSGDAGYGVPRDADSNSGIAGSANADSNSGTGGTANADSNSGTGGIVNADSNSGTAGTGNADVNSGMGGTAGADGIAGAGDFADADRINPVLPGQTDSGLDGAALPGSHSQGIEDAQGFNMAENSAVPGVTMSSMDGTMTGAESPAMNGMMPGAGNPTMGGTMPGAGNPTMGGTMPGAGNPTMGGTMPGAGNPTMGGTMPGTGTPGQGIPGGPSGPNGSIFGPGHDFEDDEPKFDTQTGERLDKPKKKLPAMVLTLAVGAIAVGAFIYSIKPGALPSRNDTVQKEPTETEIQLAIASPGSEKETGTETLTNAAAGRQSEARSQEETHRQTEARSQEETHSQTESRSQEETRRQTEDHSQEAENPQTRTDVLAGMVEPEARNKDQGKPETEAGKASGSKAETKVEAQSGTKTEIKSGTETETKSGKKAETESGVKTESKSGTKTETKSGTGTGAKPGTETETKSEKKAETESGTKTEAKSGAKTEAKSGTNTETKSEAKAETDTEAKTEKKSGAKRGTTSEASAGKKSDTSTGIKTVSGNETEAGKQGRIPTFSTDGMTVSASLDVSDMVEDVMPSVVSVTCSSVQTVLDFFYGQQQIRQTDAGSGIIVGRDEESLYIVTDAGIVNGAQEVTVGFCVEKELTQNLTDDDTLAAAQLMGIDEDSMLAVIKVPLDEINETVRSLVKVAKLGDSGMIRVGERAIAIGNAMGRGLSVTQGIISAIDRVMRYGSSVHAFIQTDASINYGNYGGALLNEAGEVIGINAGKVTDRSSEGMGYAFPINDAKEVISRMIPGSSIGASDAEEKAPEASGTQGQTEVKPEEGQQTETRPETEQKEQKTEEKQEEGRQTEEKQEEGRQTEAKQEEGRQAETKQEEEQQRETLALAQNESEEGKQETQDTASAGKEAQETEAASGKPQGADPAGNQAKGQDQTEGLGKAQSHGQLGIHVGEFSKEDQIIYRIPAGVVVADVENGSGAQAAGLAAGDLITKINDTQVSSVAELKETLDAFKPGDKVSVSFIRVDEESKYREEYERSVTVTLQ